MIRNAQKNQLLISTLAVGFFIGIIYENLTRTIQLFGIEQLEALGKIDFETREYLVYVIKIRSVQIIGVLLLYNYRWRKIILFAVSGYSGFFLARLFVSAILLHGMFGIVLGGAILFPQTLFYMLMYWIVVRKMCDERRVRWRGKQIAAVAILLTIGIWCEVYINPRIIKMIIEWI